MIQLTAGKLNRATLARQLLLERHRVGPVEGVRRVVALQAQEPASPYVALHSRLHAFDPASLDSAFTESALVKASLMRITLHAVTAGDYQTFHAAMTPSLRAARLNDKRFKAMTVTREETDAVIPDLLGFLAQPRGNAEVQAMLDERVGPQPDPGVWWALRTYAPVAHAPAGAPWTFNVRPQYRPAPVGDPVEAVDAVAHLIVRYLEGFGPAGAADIGQFSMLPMSAVKPALDSLADELVPFEGPDGKPLFDVPDAPLPDGRTAAPPRLLPMWDSTLLAYKDRSRVLPERYRRVVIRTGGDVLPSLLVNGYVVGVWRPLDGGIEVTAFEELSRAAWKDIEGEAASMAQLIEERDPQTYSRYARWWTQLPAADTRLVGS